MRRIDKVKRTDINFPFYPNLSMSGTLEMWDNQQGSLPPKMFRPLWSLLIMVMNLADIPDSRFRQIYGERFHEQLREDLTIWGEQIPCGKCSTGFLTDLLPFLPSTFAIQTQSRALFKWAVGCRARVSAKTGGRVYTEQECDRKDLDRVIAEAWDAMLLMAFGYPPLPSPAWMDRTLQLLKDMALLWPNLSDAHVALWHEIVSDPINVSTKTNLVTTVLRLRQKVSNDYRLLQAVDAVNWILPLIAYWNKVESDKQKSLSMSSSGTPAPPVSNNEETKTVGPTPVVKATSKPVVRQVSPVVVAETKASLKHLTPVKSLGPAIPKVSPVSVSAEPTKPPLNLNHLTPVKSFALAIAKQDDTDASRARKAAAVKAKNTTYRDTTK
jgi:hypothetical protein